MLDVLKVPVNVVGKAGDKVKLLGALGVVHAVSGAVVNLR